MRRINILTVHITKQYCEDEIKQYPYVSLEILPYNINFVDKKAIFIYEEDIFFVEKNEDELAHM